MHTRAKLGLSVGLVGAAMLMSSAAFAGPAYFNTSTEWADNSAESQHIDLAPAASCTDAFGAPDATVCGAGTLSRLDYGDTLRGILQINTINLGPPPTTLHLPADGPDLVAIFETEVVYKRPTGTSINVCESATCAVPVSEAFYNFAFGPTAGFQAQFGAGAMVAFLLRNADDNASTYTTGLGCTPAVVNGPPGTCETNINPGVLPGYSLYMTLGMGMDPDEGWLAFGAVDKPQLAANFRTSSALGSFAAALSVLTNNTGYNFNLVANPDALTDFLNDDAVPGASIRGDIGGSGSVTVPNPRNADGSFTIRDTNYQAEDDTRLLFSATAVPEPSTLMVMGFGLLGLGWFSRRSRASRK